MMFVSGSESVAFYHRGLSRLLDKKAAVSLLYPGFVYNGGIYILTRRLNEQWAIKK